ncbi:MAG: hydantoinase/oxoprolinase family protein, partial [Candidatus Thorarchaeota archaeon]
GGTFTDLIFINTNNEIIISKVPTTPNDQSVGVKKGVEKFNITKDNISMVHGTTVATNMILERKGAHVLLLTTEGFKDVIEIGRQNRENLYSSPTRSKSLVDRTDRIGIPERTDYMGGIMKSIEKDLVLNLLTLWEENNKLPPDSVAISFLHSFTNSKNEITTKQIVQEKWPFIPISISSEVFPVFREYERTMTTVLDAYIGPKLQQYISNLENRLDILNIKKVFILQSNTGISSPKQLHSCQAILSGLAGGVLGGIYSLKANELNHGLTLDIGGTSTDVALLYDQNVPITSSNYISGFPIYLPTVDVATIGAGGGSIAWIDKQGLLQVGPQSTGANPGPACYGNSLIPCLSDADVILGFLNPKNFAGGTVPLFPERSYKAVEELRLSLGSLQDEVSCALGVNRVFHNNIANALRSVSIERGFDPREFVLVSFGGAGPTHAIPLAELLSIQEIIIPPYPGLWSAFGLFNANFRYELTKTILCPVANITFQNLDQMFSDFELLIKEKLFNDGFNKNSIGFDRILECRYFGQSYELSIKVPTLTKDYLNQELSKQFHQTHLSRYGFDMVDKPIEIVNIRSIGIGKVRKPKINDLPLGKRSSMNNLIQGYRKVRFNEESEHEIPIFFKKDLPRNFTITDPCIIEQTDTTIVLYPNWKAVVLKDGHIKMKKL